MIVEVRERGYRVGINKILIFRLEVFSNELEKIGKNENLNIIGLRYGLDEYVDRNPLQLGEVTRVTMLLLLRRFWGLCGWIVGMMLRR